MTMEIYLRESEKKKACIIHKHFHDDLYVSYEYIVGYVRRLIVEHRHCLDDIRNTDDNI